MKIAIIGQQDFSFDVTSGCGYGQQDYSFDVTLAPRTLVSTEVLL